MPTKPGPELLTAGVLHSAKVMAASGSPSPVSAYESDLGLRMIAQAHRCRSAPFTCDNLPVYKGGCICDDSQMSIALPHTIRRAPFAALAVLLVLSASWWPMAQARLVANASPLARVLCASYARAPLSAEAVAALDRLADLSGNDALRPIRKAPFCPCQGCFMHGHGLMILPLRTSALIARISPPISVPVYVISYPTPLGRTVDVTPARAPPPSSFSL